MASDGSPGQAANSSSSAPEQFSLTAVILAHKRGSAAVIAILVVFCVLTIVTAVSGSSAGPLADSATCSQWAAASTGQRAAYSRLYLNENPTLPDTTPEAGAVTSAINKACVEAAYLGEVDDVSVLAAIRHNF